MSGHGRVAAVLAATIAFVLGGVAPGGAADKEGQVTEFSTGITPVAGTEIGAGPSSIVAGPDGNLWFTESSGHRIGQITPAGVITEFSAGLTANAAQSDITAGPDGNLWFTEERSGPTSVGSRIGRITPAGVITYFSTGIPAVIIDGVEYGSGPGGITAGPDGNLWFTKGGVRNSDTGERSGAGIGRITPVGATTYFSAGITGDPRQITAGPDGNLWFTEPDAEPGIDRVGRITPAGVVTEFSAGITGGVGGLAAGPDGNLWFTEPLRGPRTGSRIGRMTPKGKVTYFSTGITAGAEPTGITAGCDGNLWFTETSGNKIGRITPKGVVTEFSAGITADAGPTGITAGPDGNLWFTEISGHRIGRIGPGRTAKSRGRHGPTLPTACPRRGRNG